MALVVEDGSIVSGANSYASLATLRATALALEGVTLSTDDTVLERQALLAMDAIEDYRDKFVGVPYDVDTQSLEWPRSYACESNGREIEEDEIPDRVINALALYCVEIHNSTQIFDEVARTNRGQRQSVSIAGAVDVSYFRSGKGSSTTLGALPTTRITSILSPILTHTGRMLRAMRV